MLDVSDPAAPMKVGFYDTVGLAYGVAVAGGLSYVADYWGGLVLLRHLPHPVYFPIFPTE